MPEFRLKYHWNLFIGGPFYHDGAVRSLGIPFFAKKETSIAVMSSFKSRVLWERNPWVIMQSI